MIQRGHIGELSAIVLTSNAASRQYIRYMHHIPFSGSFIMFLQKVAKKNICEFRIPLYFYGQS
jgi:hypothetical protein